MPSLNTAILSMTKLWESKKVDGSHYILIIIFYLLILAIFSKRIFGIKNEYYILWPTIIILFLLTIVITSLFLTETKLMNNGVINEINSIFDNPSSRNFLSVVNLVLFTILIYELVEYDNHDPQYTMDKITMGHNNYVSNRLWGIIIIFTTSTLIGATIMATTKNL